MQTDEALLSAAVGTVAGEAFERSARVGYKGLKNKFGKQMDSASQYLGNAYNSAKEKLTAKITKESPSGPNSISATADAEAGGFSQYDQYRKSDGSWDWPENLGFQGASKESVLPVGTRIDRYGNDKGSFLSPEGTPYEQRALAPGSRAEDYNVYEVKNELPIVEGEIAPAFGQPGEGTQILPNLPERMNVKQLREAGYIERVEP